MAIVTYSPYPVALPLPQVNFTGTLSTPTETTSFTSGRVRRRKIGRTEVKKVTLEWLLYPDEYDIFEVFHRLELEMGTRPFTMDMVSGGTLQSGEHVIQFVGEPSFTYEECNWRVSVECILFQYPMAQDTDLLQSYMIYSVDEAAYILNMYYDRNYQL